MPPPAFCSTPLDILHFSRLAAVDSVRGNNLGPEGCKAVATFMERGGAPLRALDLSNNVLTQGQPVDDMPPLLQAVIPAVLGSQYQRPPGG